MSSAAHKVSTADHLVIEARPGWRVINWRELRESKDLLYFLVWKDIRVLYNQTANRLRAALLGRPNTVVANVPYRREDEATKPPAPPAGPAAHSGSAG